ncbi:mediator of RNA polymerase II transcription subunit 11 isoform X1 [Gouania willdenowi]|uniref:mediator of RNA polymerase II transcription subunit 11 isoform X1 n=1 Tax=Gouania willdenowi TaxID=441366 RepID=UPI00105588CA|nr:mitochondrial ubiquitin ligase activator of nfkb 1-A isoform X1 [Gouania willdenowi]
MDVTSAAVFCMGTCLTLSGYSYYLYRRSRATVEQLDKAPHLPIDESLKDLIRVTPGRRLQYAVIEGTVKSIGEPLRSRFYNNTLGVLHEYRLLWRSWSCPWDKSDQVIQEEASMVPFVLVGSDETTVRVENPFHASGDYMEIIKKKFYDRVWAFPSAYHISGVKPFGYMETEKMLKVGTTLTGIGELIMDRDENLSLRPPINGAKYLLSLGDFSNVKDEALSSTFWWKVQSGFFALAGVAVISWICFRH